MRTQRQRQVNAGADVRGRDACARRARAGRRRGGGRGAAARAAPSRARAAARGRALLGHATREPRPARSAHRRRDLAVPQGGWTLRIRDCTVGWLR